jgi:hypothetical protein
LEAEFSARKHFFPILNGLIAQFHVVAALLSGKAIKNSKIVSTIRDHRSGVASASLVPASRT